jgi:hypothetical protein
MFSGYNIQGGLMKPGEKLIEQGIVDLAQGEETLSELLV